MPKLLNVFLSEFVQMAKCRKEGRKGPTINQQFVDSQIPLQYKQPYITEPHLIFVTARVPVEKSSATVRNFKLYANIFI